MNVTPRSDVRRRIQLLQDGLERLSLEVQRLPAVTDEHSDDADDWREFYRDPLIAITEHIDTMATLIGHFNPTTEESGKHRKAALERENKAISGHPYMWVAK